MSKSIPLKIKTLSFSFFLPAYETKMWKTCNSFSKQSSMHEVTTSLSGLLRICFIYHAASAEYLLWASQFCFQRKFNRESRDKEEPRRIEENNDNGIKDDKEILNTEGEKGQGQKKKGCRWRKKRSRKRKLSLCMWIKARKEKKTRTPRIRQGNRVFLRISHDRRDVKTEKMEERESEDEEENEKV